MELTMAQAIAAGASAIAAGIAVFTGVGTGLSQGYAASKAVEAVSNQPEASGEITKTMILGCAVAESTGIYGFVIAILLLMANPFLG